MGDIDEAAEDRVLRGETAEQPFMALDQADLREIRPAVGISVLGAVLVLAEDEASGVAVICQQCELKEIAHRWGTVDVVGRETTARWLVLPGSDGGAWHSLLAQPLLNDFVVVTVNGGLDTPDIAMLASQSGDGLEERGSQQLDLSRLVQSSKPSPEDSALMARRVAGSGATLAVPRLPSASASSNGLRLRSSALSIALRDIGRLRRRWRCGGSVRPWRGGLSRGRVVRTLPPPAVGLLGCHAPASFTVVYAQRGA